jgi:hypothetical protein
LGQRLFPLGAWNSVPAKASQDALRLLFERWGLPERVRLDNGHPWGSSGDLPPALALWLLGLGVGLIYNPARRPQRNCFVERLQGLAEPWAEPERAASVEAYQANLDWAIRVQREVYPAIPSPNGKASGQRTRLAVYPELAVIRRPFDPRCEPESWRLERVKDYLAQGLWRRKVNKVGQITLYRRVLHVGRTQRYREVLVNFDPATTEWVIQEANGNELARHQASEITAERIRGLEVSNRPNSHQLASDTTSQQTV